MGAGWSSDLFEAGISDAEPMQSEGADHSLLHFEGDGPSVQLALPMPSESAAVVGIWKYLEAGDRAAVSDEGENAASASTGISAAEKEAAVAWAFRLALPHLESETHTLIERIKSSGKLDLAYDAMRVGGILNRFLAMRYFDDEHPFCEGKDGDVRWYENNPLLEEGRAVDILAPNCVTLSVLSIYTPDFLTALLERSETIYDLIAWAKEVVDFLHEQQHEIDHYDHASLMSLFPKLFTKARSIDDLKAIKRVMRFYEGHSECLRWYETYLSTIIEMGQALDQIMAIHDAFAPVIADYHRRFEGDKRYGGAGIFATQCLVQVLKTNAGIEDMRDAAAAINDYSARYGHPGLYAHDVLPYLLTSDRTRHEWKAWDNEIKSIMTSRSAFLASNDACNGYLLAALFRSLPGCNKPEDLREWDAVIFAHAEKHAGRHGGLDHYLKSYNDPVPLLVSTCKTTGELQTMFGLAEDYALRFGDNPARYVTAVLSTLLTMKGGGVEHAKEWDRLVKASLERHVSNGGKAGKVPHLAIRGLLLTAPDADAYDACFDEVSSFLLKLRPLHSLENFEYGIMDLIMGEGHVEGIHVALDRMLGFAEKYGSVAMAFNIYKKCTTAYARARGNRGGDEGDLITEEALELVGLLLERIPSRQATNAVDILSSIERLYRDMGIRNAYLAIKEYISRTLEIDQHDFEETQRALTSIKQRGWAPKGHDCAATVREFAHYLRFQASVAEQRGGRWRDDVEVMLPRNRDEILMSLNLQRIEGLQWYVQGIQGIPLGSSPQIQRLRELAIGISSIIDGNPGGTFRQTIHNHPSRTNADMIRQRLSEARVDERLRDQPVINMLEEALRLAEEFYEARLNLHESRQELSPTTEDALVFPTTDNPTLAEIAALAVSVRRLWDEQRTATFVFPSTELLKLIRLSMALQRHAFAACAVSEGDIGSAVQARNMAALINVLYGSGYGDDGWLAVAHRLENLASKWNADPKASARDLKLSAALAHAMVLDVQRSYHDHLDPLVTQYGVQLGLDERDRALYTSEQYRSMAVYQLAEHVRSLGIRGGNQEIAAKVMTMLPRPIARPRFEVHFYDDPRFPADLREVGGKAEGLQFMTRVVPEHVPSGIVLPTRPAGEKLTAEARAAISQAVKQLEARTGKRLGRDLFVSVRSGAAISMPGQMKTVLNLGSEQEIIAAVEDVYASWGSDGANAYRLANGIPDEFGTAVNVVEMVDGRTDGMSGSGIASSDGNGVRIVYGRQVQGDQLVSGAHLGNDPLPGKEVETALRRLIARFEEMRGGPVEVEFTIESGKLWLLQIRKAHLETHEDAGGLDVGDAQPIYEGPSGIGRPISGQIALGIEEIARIAESGGFAIFVTENPDAGESTASALAAGALLVSGGNALSHLWAVARSMNLPIMIVPPLAVDRDQGSITIGDQRFSSGDPITIDPPSGRIFRGHF
ncbi:MAG: PEP/pyruvate-binding domain-containing protein [bacterium]